jgi:BirA family transcriptional regulator, biotin operon repressor / biotin---[acetyl-CoA-carboxylase] ligase
VGSLAPEIVEPLLSGRFGHPYLYLDRCASTQRLLAEDAPEGAVAVAEEQTAGRGRLGREWSAPPRTSILTSIVLRPDVPFPRLPELSLVAGESIASAVAHAVGIQPVVKFPNDLLLAGRKVAGILAEAADGRVVLGIGVNVNQQPDELPADVSATSLRIVTGRQVDRAPLLVEILAQLERSYDRWVSALAVSG